MKKFIFVLLIALSFSAAIAKSPEPIISEDSIDIFKTPPKSSILKSPADEQQCVMECFRDYRRCLGNVGSIGGWGCELIMEQCTADCFE